MSLTCASDAYKFNLTANVVDQGGAIVGQWSETSRGITGSLQGRGGGGNFQVTAVTAGFNANISLRDHRQQADRQHQGRQPVQGRQYLAVEIAGARAPADHANRPRSRAIAVVGILRPTGARLASRSC